MAEPKLESVDEQRYELSGDLSFASVPELEHEARHLFKEHDWLDIDLKQVGRSDSAGVALLVEWVRQAEKYQCKLRFFNIPEQMLSIARVSSLDTILPLERS